MIQETRSEAFWPFIYPFSFNEVRLNQEADPCPDVHSRVTTLRYYYRWNQPTEMGQAWEPLTLMLADRPSHQLADVGCG
jgi:hypothetical protein